MLDRTLFDQQIHDIKMKYQIMSQQTLITSKSFASNAQSPFITPFRPNKQNTSINKHL
jgi:hypothetical protein